MSTQVAPTDKPRTVPDASDVANQFITQYYTLLHQDPSQLYRLYFDRSTLIFGVESDAEATPAVGTAAIKQTIADAGFDNCKVCVSNYDGQLSANNGILIQVLGELSSNDGPWRRFSQTFFLADENGRYWILNDMFRYLKSDVAQEELAEEVDEAIDTEIAQAEHDGHLVKHDVDITAAVSALQQQPDNALPEAPAEAAAIEPPQEPAPETHAAAAEHPEPVSLETKPETKSETSEAEPEAPEPASEDAPASVEDIEAPAPAAEDAAEHVSDPVPATASAAAPASAPKPVKPTSWANLAATNAGKWANQTPPTTTKAAPPPRAAPAPTNKTASKPSTPTSGTATPTAAKPAANKAAGGGRVPGASVYVRNVDKIKIDALKAAMAPFGNVLNVSMLPTGRAYVDFSSPDEARKAIAHSDQKQGVTVDLGSGQSHQVLVQTKNPSATPTLRGGRGGGSFSRAGSQGGRRGARGGAQAAR